jgi:hypothetical protein
MKKQGPWRTWLAIGLIAVGLPLVGRWSRRSAPEGCAMDGVAIAPPYRVDVVDAGGWSHAFCSLRCAEIWLGQQRSRPREITVTDELSGERLPADEAWFVRSSLVPGASDSIHVFRTRREAEKHVAAFGGAVLTGAERPLERSW